VGATGGLREAVESARVIQRDIEGFSGSVRERLGDRATFQILTGEEEAYAELIATRFVAKRKLGLGEGNAPVNFLSCGGMTSQIGYGAETKFLSFTTNVKGGNTWALDNRKDLRTALATYESRVAKAMEAAGDLKLQGLFVGIEMLGFVGEIAGIEGQILSTNLAKKALATYRNEWLAKNDIPSKDRSEWTWRQVIHPVLATATLQLLSVLDENSQIMFQREFVFDGGHTLVPSWTLGVYLEAVSSSLE